MPLPTSSNPATRIPLTRFHNNTGEILDLALRANVTLTKHGRDQWTIMPSDYVARLEAIAGDLLVAAMDRRHVPSANLDRPTRAMIEAGRPTADEIAADRWDDD